MIRRPTHAIAFLTLAGCSPALPTGGGPGSPATREVGGRDAEVELAPGGSVRLPDLGVTVTFDSVSADSRCPTDVTCVWAGDGAAHLRVTRDGAAEPLELHTTLEPRAGAAGGVAVELSRLDPTPRSDRPIDPASYRIRLRVHAP